MLKILARTKAMSAFFAALTEKIIPKFILNLFFVQALNLGYRVLMMSVENYQQLFWTEELKKLDQSLRDPINERLRETRLEKGEST